MYRPEQEVSNMGTNTNDLLVNFKHVEVKENTSLEVSIIPTFCGSDKVEVKSINLHTGRGYTFTYFKEGKVCTASGIIDVFCSYANSAYKVIRLFDRKQGAVYIDTRTIYDIVAHDKEVKTLVVAISAEILKSVIVRLSIMDDQPDEAIVYVDLKVDNLYDVTWIDKSNVVKHTYGKLTEIKEVHKHWHGGSNQFVRMEDSDHNDRRINLDNQIPGFGNLPFQEPQFGKKQTVHDIALTFDTSVTDEFENSIVYLSDIRNCKQIDELPKPLPTILPFSYMLDTTLYGIELTMLGKDIEKVIIAKGTINDGDIINTGDTIFTMNSWDGTSPVSVSLFNSNGSKFTIIVSFNDKFKNEVQYIPISISEESETPSETPSEP